MQAKLKNPYIVTNPVNDPRIFFGPNTVLRILYSIIASNQSVSLVGPRHSGKSTILRCLCLPAIQARFQEFNLSHHLFVYLDVRNCLKQTGDGFLEFVCEEIIAAAQIHFAISSTKGGGERLMDILRQVKQQGFHTVMLLDVFDEIARNKAFDPEFFLFLRAQASDGLVSYVTASIHPLHQISHRDIKGSPFFNIFAPCHIKPLTVQEVCDLVMIPPREAGFPFTQEECAWVRSLAGCHPFFVMSVCHALFTFKERQGGCLASEEECKVLVEEIYQTLVPHFRYLWDELTDDLQMSFIVRTQNLGTNTTDAPQLDLLESALFCRFVRVEHAFLDCIADELEGTLKHLDKPSLLSKSKLRYLKLVTLKIEQRGVTSLYESGLIIKEVLVEALKRLQGEGKRTDYAPSWMVYNLLDYTYFLHKDYVTQVWIADHLAISLRQYHREKVLAIQALAHQLILMEIACN